MENFIKKIKVSVDRAVAKISGLRSEDSLVFPVFTDLHTIDADHIYTKKLTETLKLITENLEYDAVINLGDNFDMLGRNIHITNDELKARFERVLTAIYEASGKHPILCANGNHDAVGTDFFKPDFWNDITKGKYGNTSAVYGEEGSYYYVDYIKANTRLVVLSLPYDSDIEAEMPTPLWGFGKKQLEWLEKTALDTALNVILVSHVPLYYKYIGDMEATLGVWDGSSAKTSYISVLCGDIEDRNEAVRIINAYNDRPDTRLVTCLSGHIHDDSLWQPYEERNGETNPLPCKQVVTASSCIGIKEPEYGIRIDVAVYTPSKNEFILVRIGDGKDRCVEL